MLQLFNKRKLMLIGIDLAIMVCVYAFALMLSGSVAELPIYLLNFAIFIYPP